MSIFAKATELEQQNIPFAVATITDTKGSAPRHTGMMIIQRDGQTSGTIGGGMIERYVIEQSLEAITAGQSRMVTGRMAQTGPDAMGMDCGGAMQVFIDVHGTKPKLFLIGAGHVNRAIAANACRLGFQVIVADAYADSLQAHYFPAGTERVLGDTMAEAIKKLDIDSQSYVVIATNHQDKDAIAMLAEQPTKYMGLLASKRKVQTLFDHLRQLGVSEQRIKQIYSPVGFDIGAETPEEIAISVIAEVLMVRSRGSDAHASQLKDDPRLQRSKLVFVRGAGDMATGVAIRLHRCGYRVVMADTEKPTVIRRTVAFAQAIYDQQITVEGVTAQRARNLNEAYEILCHDRIPVLVDAEAATVAKLKPQFVVDAILAKRNLGTTKEMAPVTIALGPGFIAGEDCHAVIETNRGHYLGRVILDGKPQQNTGEPGNIGGYTHQRVIRAEHAGVISNSVALGDLVNEGDLIATIDGNKVFAPLTGMVRGLIQDGSDITVGLKIGDVDPRGEQADYTTVSDKARAVAGGVLEAMMQLAK